MKVVINQTAALGAAAGISYYTRQLVRQLQACCGFDQIVPFPQGSLRHWLTAQLGPLRNSADRKPPSRWGGGRGGYPPLIAVPALPPAPSPPKRPGDCWTGLPPPAATCSAWAPSSPARTCSSSSASTVPCP